MNVNPVRILDAEAPLRLGRIGVWAPQLRSRDHTKIRDVAAGLEDLGFGALWAPGGWAGDLLSDMGVALSATSRIVVASGVLNIWRHEANEVAAWLGGVRDTAPGRVLLGLGVSHPNRVAEMGKTYRPMSAMRAYLDELDAADPPVASGQRVLAALGPKMLDLARERSAGVHTYTVTTAHTAAARAALGADRLVAPEVKVVLDADRARALDTARAHLGHYLNLENYANNLRRIGYGEDDLVDGGSEGLIGDLFAIGGVDAVRQRVEGHLVAGADHVCLQVVTRELVAAPWADWRRLADSLTLS